jgi:hypothetical protein
MSCDERCKQSERMMHYMTLDPSNHVEGIDNCVQIPGMVCKSMHVKDQVDTETSLIRGTQSVAVDPNPGGVNELPKPQREPRHATYEALPSFWGEMTRDSKSCNSENNVTERLESIQWGDIPYADTNDLIGTNSRQLAKYGKN